MEWAFWRPAECQRRRKVEGAAECGAARITAGNGLGGRKVCQFEGPCRCVAGALLHPPEGGRRLYLPAVRASACPLHPQLRLPGEGPLCCLQVW